MKKPLSSAFSVLLMVLAMMCGCAEAVETPVPAVAGMEYTVTIKKVEFFNESTGLWVTACGTAGSFDIASAGSGAEIASLVAGVRLPSGTYSRMRITIGNRFRIKAFVAIGAFGRCTGGSARIGNNTFAAAVNCSSIAGAVPIAVSHDFASAVLGEGQEAVGTDLRSTHFIPPFLVGSGSGPRTAEISFRLHNTLKHYSAGHFGPGTPETITPGHPEMTEALK